MCDKKYIFFLAFLFPSRLLSHMYFLVELQRAKKVVSNSLGLVDFARANEVFWGIQITEELWYQQGSQIRQIWRILRQNCSDDSTEVTEGVTSTPEIFGNKQGATLTPEIFANKHSFVLTFFRNKYKFR